MLKVHSCEIGQSFLSKTVVKLVLKNTASLTKKPIHWILNWDVSGSMSWALNQVKRDMNGFIAALPADHLVSIVTFSGHNEAKLIANTVKCDEAGKKNLSSKINLVRIIGTTVFSEGLEIAMNGPVKDTKDDDGTKDFHQQVILFTDGQAVPTLWSEAKEMEKSFVIGRSLRAYNAHISTIGYGHYYNDWFLNGLVKSNGDVGISRHINDITDFGAIINSVRNASEMVVPVKADFTITARGTSAGTVLRSTPQVVNVSDIPGRVSLRSVNTDETVLYFEVPNGTKEITLNGFVDGKTFNATVIGKSLSQESSIEAALALASWQFQNGEIGAAASLLKESGNEMLALLAGSAYTDRERMTVGDQMRRVLLDGEVRQRYATKKYIGAGEAACTVNLLRVLLEESCTVFIPRGTYEKTTITVVEDGMRHKPNAKIKMIEIQSKQDRYNFSMKTVVDVEKKDSATGKWNDDTSFRNYVIIKDGNLHQDTLEAYLTEKAFDLCLRWGVIPSNSKFSETHLYTLDLTVLPMIVSSWANPKNLGLIDLMKEELIAKAMQTALNRHIKNLREKAGVKPVYPRRVKLDGVVDTYSAPAYEYELKGPEEPRGFNFSKLDLKAAEKEATKLRKRLLVVRCLKRLILFAMDKSGNKLFSGITPTPVKGSTKGKMEQTVNLASLGEPSLSLRRITWTEMVEVTGKEDESEDLAFAA